MFPIEEILLVVLCGTLARAEDLVEMRRWAVVHGAFLRKFLPFVRGILSHDTLNDVVNALDGDLFSQCFTQWVDDLRRHQPDMADPEVVAIDGKTSRRTHDRGRDHGSLHMVTAWASAQRLVLGQQACEAKSNEITAIPQLRDRLALTGALVTIDAMGCETKIAEKILDRGGDYLLAVKDNQPSLHDKVGQYFSQADPAKLERLETTDGEHVSIEVRRHAVSTDVDWLTTDRHFPGEPRFPGLVAIAMVEAEVERNGNTSVETRYFFCSLLIIAAFFAKAVRCHWHIENRLHWVLDVVFHEDLNRLRSRDGPRNIAPSATWP